MISIAAKKTYGLRLLFLAIIPLLHSSCIGQEKEPQSSTTKPNVVLIFVDDLGWKDLGFMGSEYYETPNLDAFAKQGIVFTNGYASAANCAPSRACMLSGLNSTKHGVYTVNSSSRGDTKTRKLIPVTNTLYLQDSIYTLHEMFKSAGYTTSNFGKWHVGIDPKTQGVDVNIGGGKVGNPSGKGGYFTPYNVPNIKDGPKGEYLTDRLTNEAISFIEDNKDHNFFAYIPYYTVHTPIMGKESWIAKYKAKQGSNGQKNPTYGAMVSAMDENVGKLLSALKKLNLEENTLVIFTSDNGGVRSLSSQTPLRTGKGSYYEGGIRVPLVIKWPGKIKPGTTSTTRVTNLDFYPTLQEIVKPKNEASKLDGVDITPLFNDHKITNRELVWHFPIYLQGSKKASIDLRDPLFRTRPGSIIISDNWKLHEYFEDGGIELYNLSNDVGERNNLREKHPEKVKELYNKLQLWRQKNNAPIPTKKNPEYDSIFEASIFKKRATE